MRIPRLPAHLTASLALLALTASGCFKNEEGTATDGSTGTGGTDGTVGTVGTDDGDATKAEAGDTSSSSSGDEPTAGPTTESEPTGSTTTPATETTVDPTGMPVEGCAGYCELITANCGGDFTQYGAPATCLSSCEAFAPGVEGDMAGNTLACRTYHAGAAAMADDVHCTHAGPGGDGACGTNCEGFCAIAADACPEAWPDIDSCLTACLGFPAEEKYDATDVGGNTLACRLYHVTAATVDPVTHCGHIKGDSPTCK